MKIHFKFILVLLYISFINNIFATTITYDQTNIVIVQKKIINEAKSYLGVPYVWGGITSNGFDCSGLVFRVFSDIVDYPLPRQVGHLIKEGKNVKREPVNADLVFFATSGGREATHVGIYIGNNKFIHAASAGKKKGVIISSLTENYYRKRYLGARRIVNRGYPLIKIVVDNNKPARSSYPGIFSPGIPLYFSIESKLEKSAFIEFTAYKNKKAVLSKRMHLGGDEEPSVLWFIPDAGTWSVIFRNENERKFAQVLFTIEAW